MSNFFSPSASATSSSTSSSSRSVPSDGAAKPLTAASASPHNILLRCPSPPVHPQSHTAFLIPLCRCCHIHQYPNLCSPQHHLYLLPRPSTSTSTSISAGHGGPISESSSNRSFSTDPYSYTTDCSPRSVIRHVYSSSSGPSPGPGFSNLHSTYCMGASGEVAKKKCHTVVGTSSSMIDNQHSTLNDESRSVVLGLQDRHVLMQGHPSILAQWNSSAEVQNEEFTHTRQGDLYSEGRLSITHVQNSSRIYHNAESEKVSVQDSRLTKIPMQEQKCILTSGSAQTEKNGGIDSLSASMGLNRSDVTGVRHGAGECYSEVQCSGIQDRKESDAERDSATNTHLRWPGVLVATSDAPSNKIQGQNHGADQRQRMSHPCSLNSDLQDDEGNSPGLWMRGNAVVAISTANGTSKCSDAVTSKSTDTVLGYVDGMRTFHHHHHHHHHHHLRARQRNTLGSKWEDAERWLRPAAQQHHQSMACRRLIPRFGLLRMSDCLSTGTSALQPHSFQPMPVDLNCVADHSPLHSSCACWKYESLCSCKHAVLSSTHTHDGCGSSAPSKEPETVIGHATSTVSKPSISVDCFDVDLINHKLNMSSPKDHVADQNMRGQIPNDPHAQKYCIEKIDQSNDYITSTEPIGECGEPSIPRPLPRSTNYGIVTPFTGTHHRMAALPGIQGF
ncbi:hypothetical protein KP509_11G051700 [Ceratopteris richardii]|uniref:Uncharacterized protein n=1 Tax=Ceratopteris richardii TaxID=49495 RepID=A0A8T2TVB2_CERRI|nr:hypothetical protein KP509_11G051700 [Ceratopteris richardii]